MSFTTGVNMTQSQPANAQRHVFYALSEKTPKMLNAVSRMCVGVYVCTYCRTVKCETDQGFAPGVSILV